METSRVNLSALALALIAGLIVLHDSQTPLLGSLAGLTLLIVLFAFSQEGARTGFQSFAFALVGGLALLCTCSFGLKALVGPLLFSGQDILPPLVWVAGTTLFWFVDRSRAEPAQMRSQAVSLNTYSQPVAPAAETRPAYETRPFTPAPVVVSAPPPPPPPMEVASPEPVYAVASPAPPPPAAPPTAPTAAAPVPPVLTGKEVSIYVNMMGEGMNLLRPVRAEHLGRDFYIIVDEMPADENWEYVPGQVVRCKKKNLSNGKGLVAFEEAPRAQ
jgi:hypothetical protein